MTYIIKTSEIIKITLKEYRISKTKSKIYKDKSTLNKLSIKTSKKLQISESYNYKIKIKNLDPISERQPKTWMKVDKIIEDNPNNTNNTEEIASSKELDFLKRLVLFK